MADRLVATWYAPKPTLFARALWPLSIPFRMAVAVRRSLYRTGLLAAHELRVPVVVIGNVTVGGAGKTPLALALAQALEERGRRPGIVSRGYGGSNVAARAVVAGDDARVVGDEPLLYANAGLPVWIGHRRADAAQALVAARPDVDVVIADDGLQHYALSRAMEIAVVDGARAGNGMLLPAGPLREPPDRLNEVDAIVRIVSREEAATPSRHARSTRMWLETLPWRNLAAPERAPAFDRWPQGSIHAVAGIAHPERFFSLLRKLGIEAQCHPFPDHHFYSRDDLAFAAARAILMTEKDAVKCVAFADERFWCLPVRARIEPALVEFVLERLHGYQAA